MRKVQMYPSVWVNLTVRSLCKRAQTQHTHPAQSHSLPWAVRSSHSWQSQWLEGKKSFCDTELFCILYENSLRNTLRICVLLWMYTIFTQTAFSWGNAHNSQLSTHRQPRCLSTDNEQEMWYTHNKVLISHKEWNYAVCHTVEQLSIIILSGKKDPKRQISHLFFHLWLLLVSVFWKRFSFCT